ncbi:MAG: chromosomal replication initiator protein DnaA [Myxococcales bacterium]|nr:chromosomal replication initiator protein DnaA [Myxococcales bacterium]MDD9970533.1 chromosomal replication initiator protein DnaA [Myxococcales bacterium]
MTAHWRGTLDDLRENLSTESFQTWLEPVQCGGFRDEKLELRIPNRFYADWIRTHYLDLLLDSLRRRSGQPSLDIVWAVDEALAESMAKREKPAGPSIPPPKVTPPPPPPVQRESTNLNPKYHFDTFVVGPSNQLAHAASTAAANNPGERYNPLFIYGGVGLGKTHLVNAVGHRVLHNRPSARILYVSAERFTNEFIWALQNHRIDEFRTRYRTQCDVLLMDDIQFLASREQTQEEFFHTFNALYHSDRQIVVSSDVYPQQIGKMEERLISRFQWGMVADIQAPELDTRVAIVRKKAEQEGIELVDDVAHFLAQTVKSNVRELEGTLLRLAVKAELLKRPIDLDFARETLRATIPPPESVATVDDIQRAVCEHFNVRMSDMKSHRRHRSIAHPRMVAMYLCRQRLKTSYTELGDRFGGKDHTTVLSAVRKIESRLEADDMDLQATVEAIERRLGR